MILDSKRKLGLIPQTIKGILYVKSSAKSVIYSSCFMEWLDTKLTRQFQLSPGARNAQSTLKNLKLVFFGSKNLILIYLFERLLTVKQS